MDNLKTRTIEYFDANQLPLKGYLACDDKNHQPQPAVIVAHDWTGCNDFARKKAETLAKLGYVGFALDMYGQGKLGSTTDEKKALIAPLLQDRALLQQRINAAVDTVKKLPEVNPKKIAAIGFCFGGLCVLDLARSGAAINGVVSFHGLFTAPSNLVENKITAKVLALHGHDDPMVPPEQVAAFTDEMTKNKVDWQLHIYGNTMHGFTNPQANDPSFGTVYNEIATKRAWQTMENFLREIFN